MAATLQDLAYQATALRDRSHAASSNIADASSEIERLRSDMGDCSSAITELKAEMRSVRRADRQWYREQICDAKERKESLRGDLADAYQRKREAIAEERAVRGEIDHLKRFLRSDASRLAASARSLPRSRDVRIAPSIDALRHQADRAAEQVRQLIQFLDSDSPLRQAWDGSLAALDDSIYGSIAPAHDLPSDEPRPIAARPSAVGDPRAHAVRLDPAVITADDDLTYVPIDDGWNARAAANGLVCIDVPNRECLPLPDHSRTFLYDSIVLEDSLDVAHGDMERIGIQYATALLGAEGRKAILPLGGPGRPDMLSLDAARNLWITEIKGTGRDRLGLHETGLLRTLSDGHGGTIQLFENSSAWLQRSGVDVMQSIDAAIKLATEPAEAEALAILKDRYVDAVRFGFASDEYKNEVVQVGLLPVNADYLRPLTASDSALMQSFLEEVQPDRIAQLNVIEGSGGFTAHAEAEDSAAVSRDDGGGVLNAESTGACSVSNNNATSAEAASQDDSTAQE